MHADIIVVIIGSVLIGGYVAYRLIGTVRNVIEDRKKKKAIEERLKDLANKK